MAEMKKGTLNRYFYVLSCTLCLFRILKIIIILITRTLLVTYLYEKREKLYISGWIIMCMLPTFTSRTLCDFVREPNGSQLPDIS